MNQQQSPNAKINKTLYIVSVVLLFAIAVVIAITTAANRKEKPPKLDTESDTVIESRIETEPDETAPVTTDRTKDSKKEDDTKKPPKENDPSSLTPAEPTVSAPTKLNLPTVGFLSKKHDTNLQVYSLTMNDYRVHNGIDIVTEEGAPVYSAADGTVSQVWDDPLMGKSVAIAHVGDSYTIYKNLSAELAAGIEEGAKVKSGQLIASVGNTAMIEIAEEPHLHFELTVSGKTADPLDYFDEASLVSLTIDSSYES